ncbi:MAG: IS1634 family transposase [Mariprofundaceae bacterium]
MERLDHLGIVAGVIKELKIAEFIDERLGTFEGETLSAGETVAGMIINGLGFSNKPLSLTPLFFKNCPLSLLFHEGVKAEDFNRFKLGRVLDRCHSYGTELLFGEISLNVCQQEDVNTTYRSLDSTSLTLSGDYLGKTGDDEVAIKLGHSKDHRPDLKQVMLEMIVCHDGGIPLIGKALDGNASDNMVFKERSEQLIESFKASEIPRYLIADCKLYTEKNAPNLKQLQFITRIPNAISLVGKTIDKALETPDDWKILDDGRHIQTFNIEHYGIKQRWHVLSSETSKERAMKQVDKKVSKEAILVEKQLFHLQAQRFNCAEDAISAATILAKKWKFHHLTGAETTKHLKYEGKGRPKKGQLPSVVTYQLIGQGGQDSEKIERAKIKGAHYIIGSNIASKELSNQEIIHAYKEQHQVERGFRFLKDPLFFTSSLFVKKPKRIMALLMVMLLSLLVYGIAERRMRAHLEEQKKTLPNQINQPTARPTLRWVFQLLHGIHCLEIVTEKSTQQVIEGLTPLREKVLRLFGKNVANIYQIPYE